MILYKIDKNKSIQNDKSSAIKSSSSSSIQNNQQIVIVVIVKYISHKRLTSKKVFSH